MNMQIIQSAADINKAILSIKARGAKLDGDIHIAGVSVLKHANMHGDVTLADKLVQAMPKGGRKNALVAWMLAFGQVEVLDAKQDKDAIASGRLFKCVKAKAYNEAHAIETAWTEFKKEADPVAEFNAEDAVKSLLARLKKATDGKVTIVGQAAALAQAQALVTALSAPAYTSEVQDAPF